MTPAPLRVNTAKPRGKRRAQSGRHKGSWTGSAKAQAVAALSRRALLGVSPAEVELRPDSNAKVIGKSARKTVVQPPPGWR